MDQMWVLQNMEESSATNSFFFSLLQLDGCHITHQNDEGWHWWQTCFVRENLKF